MKKLFVSLVVLVFFLGLTVGCVDSSKQEQGKDKFIGVRKQHDTRVFILCKDNRGEYYEKSLHKSTQIICDEKTYKIEDFLTKCKTDCYIAIPGHEKELESYLIKLKIEKTNF